MSSLYDDMLKMPIKEFASKFRERLAQYKVSVMPLPEVSHADLVSRAVKRRKPFGEREGYRDELIWESVLGLASCSKKPVIFVLPNHHDFGVGKSGAGLHKDLLDDLRERGMDAQAVVYAEELSAALIASKAVTEILDVDEWKGLEAKGKILSSFVNVHDDVLHGRRIDGGMPASGSYMISMVCCVARVEPGKGFLLSNGKTLLQAKAFIQVQLEEIPDDIELLREIPEELAGQLVRRSDLELLKI